jgi:hypothetical protein
MSRPLVKDIPRLRHMRQEALRLGGWTPELRRYLRENRLDLGNCIAHASWLNIALVKFWTGNDGDETFAFTPDGVPAAVIEAVLFDWQAEPFCADLVAWPLHDPTAFVTAMGLNDGADVLGPHNMVKRCGEPLRIHRTPLQWLQAGGDGCCLLKPGARRWLRKAGGPFVCEDIDHGREVRDLLGRDGAPMGHHRILVPADSVGRCA